MNVVGAVLIPNFLFYLEPYVSSDDYQVGILLCKRRDRDVRVMSKLTERQTFQRIDFIYQL